MCVCVCNCCFVGCFYQDLLSIVRSIFAYLPSRFFSIPSVSIYGVYPYNSIATTTAWEKLHFILADRSDFHMIDNR